VTRIKPWIFYHIKGTKKQGLTSNKRKKTTTDKEKMPKRALDSNKSSTFAALFTILHY